MTLGVAGRRAILDERKATVHQLQQELFHARRFQAQSLLPLCKITIKKDQENSDDKDGGGGPVFPVRPYSEMIVIPVCSGVQG
jgi:hypothetical protein